ncbi:MAG: c-type cytochrome [Burkholderiaceae bacterium]
MKKTILSVFAATTMLAAASAQAVSFAKPDDAIKYRQGAFKVMATHFGDIGAMVKGDKPFDAKAAAANADIVATLSALPWAAFGPGTEGGKAKPAIWKEMDKVKAGAGEFQKAAAALKTAAASGNLDNIKKAFSATQKTCKSCHDSYKDK